MHARRPRVAAAAHAVHTVAAARRKSSSNVAAAPDKSRGRKTASGPGRLPIATPPAPAASAAAAPAGVPPAAARNPTSPRKLGSR